MLDLTPENQIQEVSTPNLLNVFNQYQVTLLGESHVTDHLEYIESEVENMMLAGVTVFGFETIPEGITLGSEEDINHFISQYFPDDDRRPYLFSLMTELRNSDIDIIGLDLSMEEQLSHTDKVEELLREAFEIFQLEDTDEFDIEEVNRRKTVLQEKGKKLEASMLDHRSEVFARNILKQAGKGVYLMGELHMLSGESAVTDLLEQEGVSAGKVSLISERVKKAPFDQVHSNPTMVKYVDSSIAIYFPAPTNYS